MTYLEAVEIEIELSVSLQYLEPGQKQEDVFPEWFNKHGYKKIEKCIETLCEDLDRKRSHYMDLLKIARIMTGACNS
jgi:hypothetical protein